MFGVSPWAICCVIGFWLAVALAEQRARVAGMPKPALHAALTWVFGTAFLMGHLVDVLFYHRELLSQPASLVHFFNGQSSTGGFLGAVVGGWLWSRILVERRGVRFSVARRPAPVALLPLADILCATYPAAFFFGRLGCALIHDHPGRLAPAGSWLALAWPVSPSDGAVHELGPLRYVYGSSSRYDLGLLECGFTLLIALAFAATWRRPLALGSYACAVCLAYPPVRFTLDFLRVEGVVDADPRYVGLTFAQWFCVAMFACGVGLALQLGRARAVAHASS
jgi:phosphatidylglycerol:prolipoprotein diacylglycerol transferase